MTSHASATDPPILRLSAELLDCIFSFLAPHNNKQSRRQLACCLRVCSAFAPIARRRLFAKTIICLGAKDRRDVKFLRLINHEKAVTGEFVRSIKLTSPEPGLAVAPPPDHPATALVPVSTLTQTDVVTYVCSLLELTPKLAHLEIETRIATRVEDEPLETTDLPEEALLDRTRDALVRLQRVTQFAIAVAHEHQKLHVLAEAAGSFVSPWTWGIASWANLTHLDLWRVRLQFGDDAPPTPTFKLVTLAMQAVELGSERELEWLFGETGGSRSSELSSLMLDEVTFLGAPSTSQPLLSVFGNSTSRPSFASTLTSLTMNLQLPLSNSEAGATLLSPFTRLTSLRLIGPGIPTQVVESLTPAFKPVTTLKSLQLSSLLSIPQPDLIAWLGRPGAFPSLKELDVHLISALPRKLTWEQIRVTPLPLWEWSDESWRDLERVVRRLPPSANGERVVLKRSGVMTSLDWSSEDEEEYGSEDGTEGDWDALFVPSSDPEPEVDWRRYDDAEESDF